MEKEEVVLIDLKLLKPSPTNPRKAFPEADEAELAQLVKEKGIIFPLTVRKGAANGAYEIVDGERRYRAAKKLGLQDVPCLVRILSDGEVRDAQLISHLQHKNLLPLDEANSLHALASGVSALSIEQIANRTGKSANYIATRMKLTDLCPEAKKMLEQSTLPLAHALELCRLSVKDQEEIIEDDFWGDHVPPLKELKESIKRNVLLILSSAPFKLDDGDLLPAAGPCNRCPKNTGLATSLFEDLDKKARCSDRGCFETKVNAYCKQELDLSSKTDSPLIQVRDEWGSSGKILGRDGYEKTNDKKAPLAIVVEGDHIGQKFHIKLTKSTSVSKALPESPARSAASRKIRDRRKAEILNNRIEARAREITTQKLVTQSTGDIPVILIPAVASLLELSPFSDFGDKSKTALNKACELAGIAAKFNRSMSFDQRIALLKKCTGAQLFKLTIALGCYREWIDDPLMTVHKASCMNFLLSELPKVRHAASIIQARSEFDAKKGNKKKAAA